MPARLDIVVRATFREYSRMKPPTDRLRVYAIAASLSLILIQAAVVVSILLLHVPIKAFESQPFRAALLAAVGCAVLVVRWQARRARRKAERFGRSHANLRASRAACASMRAARERLRARKRAYFSRPRAARASPD